MTGRRALDEEARRVVADLARRGLARAPTGTEGLVDLVTNDALGLRRDARVLAAAATALARRGLGSGGSRLLGGDAAEHARLEEAFARLQGEEAAVLFPSGTAANHGAVTAVAGEGDLVVSDASNHGSLVDAIRATRARRTVVAHLDVAGVEDALARDVGGGRRVVVLESLHGMDGDAWPLGALAEVCRRRDALLVVDEAHALGVRGPDGAGLVAEAGVEDVVAARTNPCGKALGGAGGVVTCSAGLAQRIVHTSRAYAYTTALAPAVAAGVLAALRLAVEEPWRRERCRALVDRAAQALRRAGARVLGTEGAFVPWVLGSAGAALEAAQALRARGFAARAVRPPTVPEGTARIRLALHADLTEDEERRLHAALHEVVRSAAA